MHILLILKHKYFKKDVLYKIIVLIVFFYVRKNTFLFFFHLVPYNNLQPLLYINLSSLVAK